MCNGESLPFFEVSSEILTHIAEVHFPLRCSKCSRIFDDVSELSEIGKCCKVAQSPELAMKLSEIREESYSSPVEDKTKIIIENATPLTQINQRWRRKSREFGKNEYEKEETGTVVRQTSTPMQLTSIAANFTDSSSYNGSSIQISSINCISSCSSESDEFSPPLPPPKTVAAPLSPKVNRSRPKLPVQATPLRQVMSKSIQRAIAEHGHYRNSKVQIQQRKMSFNSTNSSGECTTSFMKLPGGNDSPLDLRMSPALRRINEETKENQLEYHQEPGDLINFDSEYFESQNSHLEIEHFKVVIRRSEIKSDSSAMTSYKSVFSDSGRSGSMPEIQFTPKIAGHNFYKKTISFETPDMEKTPGCLMPIEDDGDEDDVFYTPRASPASKSFFRRASTDTIIPIEDETEPGSNNSKSKTIWNLVSLFGDNLKKFKKPEFVKRAADYFLKRSSEPDEFPHKRRRTSSTSSNDVNFVVSPATKRQKIQGRKPISRLRHMSLN